MKNTQELLEDRQKTAEQLIRLANELNQSANLLIHLNPAQGQLAEVTRVARRLVDKFDNNKGDLIRYVEEWACIIPNPVFKENHKEQKIQNKEQTKEQKHTNENLQDNQGENL